MIKVSVKFLILLILSYAFALIQGGNLPYSIFHGLILTFIVGLIYILSKQKSIVVQVKFDKKVYSAGDEHEFTTIVKNYGIFPAPYVILKNKTLTRLNQKYNGDAIYLNSDESKWIKSKIKFNQRGIYNFGEFNLKISDLFCIFERSRNINLGTSVKVYPKVYELNKFLANGSDIFKNATSCNTNIEDLYSTRDIRKYNEGDNLKRVNWKVSAKHGELFVRNLDTVSGDESNIFLNMSKENMVLDDVGVAEEQLIDLCSSIINYMQIKGIRSKLFINSLSERRFDIDTREDFNDLMEFFTTQSSDGENDFTRFINSNLNKIPRLSWIGIITSSISDNLKDNLILMKDKGYNITVFYSTGTLKDLSYTEELWKLGIYSHSFNELVSSWGSR